MSRTKIFPTISVVIPVFNEEKNLIRLFKSISKQSYLKSRIEYIVIDDGSTDNSAQIAKKHGVRVIKVNTHDIELNKGTGMYLAKNDFVYWLDADMELCSNNFWELLIQPLIDNPDIIGSFTREFAMDVKTPVNNSLLRFISTDDFQRDTVYRFFSKTVESSVIERNEKYQVCHFFPGDMPPVGRILYRRKELLNTDVGADKTFIDMESVEIVARAGHQLFAFVPQAKMRHYHAHNLMGLINKRLRNLERDYLPNIDHKYFTWIKTNDKKEVIKILIWIVYANLFFPELIKGIYKACRHRDKAYLWHPVVSIAVTDSIVWGFLSKTKGRQFALKLFGIK